MGTIDNSPDRPVESGPSQPVHVTNKASQPVPTYQAPAPAGTPPPPVEYTTYTDIATGEFQGSLTPVRLPTIACKLAKLKAQKGNSGNVYLGWNAGVTKPDGTTDTSTGLELAPGDETGWIPIANLNLLYLIADNAGDDLSYVVMIG